MSMDYWMCEGYGFCIDDFWDKIDRRKVLAILRQLFREETEGIDSNLPDEKLSRLVDKLVEDDLDFCGGYAELLTDLDDTRLLSWNTDRQGRYFLLYPPCYPWSMSGNEPKTVREVLLLLSSVAGKITNISEEEICSMVDYIEEVGCG